MKTVRVGPSSRLSVHASGGPNVLSLSRSPGRSIVYASATDSKLIAGAKDDTMPFVGIPEVVLPERVPTQQLISRIYSLCNFGLFWTFSITPMFFHDVALFGPCLRMLMR